MLGRGESAGPGREQGDQGTWREISCSPRAANGDCSWYSLILPLGHPILMRKQGAVLTVMSPTGHKAMPLQAICGGHTPGKPYVPTLASCEDWADTQWMVCPRLSPPLCTPRTCHDITHGSVIVSVHPTPPHPNPGMAP